jgi:type I site-specific restriction endonuclease
MVQATAAQQQCYMVSINGTGRTMVLANLWSQVLRVRLSMKSLSGEETLLFEVDLNKVRRTRERGILSLGQPLKSYRDHILRNSEKYSSTDSQYLESLGPLEIPKNEV